MGWQGHKRPYRRKVLQIGAEDTRKLAKATGEMVSSSARRKPTMVQLHVKAREPHSFQKWQKTLGIFGVGRLL